MTDQPVRPVNPEAERYVLGACMLSHNAVVDVTEVLQARDFYEPRHSAIFAAIRRLQDDDKPTDIVAVEDELRGTGEQLGNLDIAYLSQLTSEVPTSTNASYWAGIVKDAAVRRHVMDAANRAAAIASDPAVPAEDAVELAREVFDRVDDTTAAGVETMGDWFLGYLGGLSTKPKYTPSPWYDLNVLINGFRDGGMYVVAARPGQGKTMVGVQLARHFAKERPVLFASLEMGRDEIAARILAAEAQIFIGALNRHALSKTDWDQVQKHRATLASLPLVITGSDEVSTIPQLKAKARSVTRRFGRTPIVIVDYLQLLSSPTPVESRQVEVAGFSRSLKLAAQTWDVPVLALSQLNRASAARRGQEPALTDLRESGAIEQDADAVLLLHRKQNRGAADDLKVIVAKNRQGQTGDALLTWQGQFSRVLAKGDAREYLINEQGGFS